MKLAANGSASFPRLGEFTGSSNGEEGGEESTHEPGEEGGEKFDAKASVGMEGINKCDRRLVYTKTITCTMPPAYAIFSRQSWLYLRIDYPH